MLLLVLLFSCYVQRVNILGLMLALTANTVLFYKYRIHSENSIQNVSGKLQNAVTVIPVVLLLVFLFTAVLSLPSSDFSNVKDNLQKQLTILFTAVLSHCRRVILIIFTIILRKAKNNCVLL